MKRILLRSPKSPFKVVSPATVHRRNLIGQNSGNLIFIQAAHRILSTRGVEIDAAGLEAPDHADEVNERYSVYVIPLANAFRPSFRASLERMTRFIKRLKIPVVVLGVGAQGTVAYDFDRLQPINNQVREFVSAVLERSTVIGVRGEATEAHLRSLGFRDVEVIGCPSMFLNGERLVVEKRLPALDRESRISINISPYRREMGDVLMRHLERYPNLVYIAQDRHTLGMMLNGEYPDAAATVDRSPVHLSHPVFQQRRARFYVEPWPWIADLKEFDFSFGSRIHGNIAAILAGTPAYAFAHDSRTLELARYFAIPHRLISEVGPGTDAADLYAEADYRPLVGGHAARFHAFADYLGRHGLAHVFTEGEDAGAYDARIAATTFPKVVTVSPVVMAPGSMAARLHLARGRLTRVAPLAARVARAVRQKLLARSARPPRT